MPVALNSEDSLLFAFKVAVQTSNNSAGAKFNDILFQPCFSDDVVES